ncbi:glycoside hydrolase [Polyplosphaeria fusca]|uniref:beta-N-acetylhexosaminidase n=1 Tax=Polyplosphaeria fusca TaxID=682080 RepID=A0A9P4R7A9_9PLEO|nr:glycoside hydrolase [Polyplosphaeria fusca]
MITILLCVLLSTPSVTSRSLGIPTTSFSPSHGHLSLSNIKSIIVDDQYAQAVDESGQTLIPPTLQDFAKTFAGDLKSLHVNATVAVGKQPSSGSVFLTLGDSSQYRDAAGRPSSEGYSLTVSSSGINITGASPLGAWWGTRTVLQQAVLTDGAIPYGSGSDTPGWATRGMMLDAGRHYYPPEFLVEMCAYMSYFKQNTLHLHLSDNLYNNVGIYTRERSLELYARFRLWSESPDVSGLNKYQNESYTREQFDYIQNSCVARGVTILPEIEAPGHALVFVQWKPQLGLSSDLSLLNISNPETIPTMKSVWSTFLPFFHTKTVHIGADEYTAEVNDYNSFVNAMANHIRTVSNKSTRIWGTFPPKDAYNNIHKNISMQHWEFFEDNPLYDYIRNNYSVLNSDDTYYVVNKWSGSYPQVVPISRTFNSNPANNGMWYPYIFDTRNETNNPPSDEPLVLGAVAPLWNDYGANASVYSEAYYAWKDGIPALADKQWGGSLTSSEFDQVFEKLHPYIPGQNLDRNVSSKTSTLLDYSFDNSSVSYAVNSDQVPDRSMNGYVGTTNCTITSNGSLAMEPNCFLASPLSSKGRNYTLTLTLLIDEMEDRTATKLITGSDSILMLTPNITLFASGEYFRLTSTIPLKQKVDLSIIGRGTQTFAKINKGKEEEFVTKMGINGEGFELAPIAIEAPVEMVGGPGSGWSGRLWGLKLTNVA